jgi:electron transfer flavoprotein alpha subunit
MAFPAGRTALRQLRLQNKLRLHITSPRGLRSLSSLAILEQRDGQLNTGSLAAVVAAQKLGGSVTAFVAGKNAKAVAEAAAKVKGIEKVIYVDNEAYERVLGQLNIQINLTSSRVLPKTTLLSSSKRSKTEDSHTY